jgi:FkbM family methyltransferase
VLKRWLVRAPQGTVRHWLTLVTTVSRCGAGRRMRLKMVALGLAMPLRDRLLGPRDVKLRIRYGRLDVPWTVGPKSDFEVLNEVLVLRCYERGLPPTEPATILDLGSHMGASILFWRERYPDSRVVAVEPDPVTFGRLRRNVGSMRGVELRNVAVAQEDRPVQFFSAQQGWVSSLWGTGKPVWVTGRSFRALVQDVGKVDLLKVDMEGAEEYILDDCALHNVSAIVGEYHHIDDQELRERFFDGLRRHFKLADEAPFIMFSGSRGTLSD